MITAKSMLLTKGVPSMVFLSSDAVGSKSRMYGCDSCGEKFIQTIDAYGSYGTPECEKCILRRIQGYVDALAYPQSKVESRSGDSDGSVV